MKGYNYLNPEDITRENLVTDDDFLDDAASYLWKQSSGEVDLTDPDEIYEEFQKRMRYHDVNEVDTISDLMYAQEADEESKLEMGRLFDVYDKSEMSTEDIGDKAIDYAVGLVTAPSTWLGLLTGGSGKAVSVVGQQATKQLVRTALKSALKAGLVEGGIGAGQNVAQQGTRMELDSEREFSGTELALTSGLSAIPGVVLGGANAVRLGRGEIKQAGVLEEATAAKAELQATATVRAKETIEKAKVDGGREETLKEIEDVLDELEPLMGDAKGKKPKLDPIDPIITDAGEEVRLGIEPTPEGLEVGIPIEKKEHMLAAILDFGTVIQRTSGKRITEDLVTAIGRGEIPGNVFNDIKEKYNLNDFDIKNMLGAEFSRAGRTLNISSQLSKNSMRQLDKMIEESKLITERLGVDVTINKEVAKESTIKSIANNFNAFERVRRSIMTSQPVTTLRNVFGGIGRIGVDTLEEAVETSTINLYNGLSKFVPGMKRIESERSLFNSADIFKYTLDTPEANLIADMYKNIDQKGFDRYFTGFIDSATTASKLGTGGSLEKVGNFFNYFNKMSDNFNKKAAFAGELSRLVKANYDVELIDLIKAGKFDTIDPKLFNEAMDKGFELVYQKTPKGSGIAARAARGYLNNIDKPFGFATGVIIPFPRFVINQIQFMYEHIPLLGMIPLEKVGAEAGSVGRSMSKRIAQQASGGIMMAGAFFALRNTQDPGTLWYNFETEKGTVDLRPFLGPMNLELYMADLALKLHKKQPLPDAVGFTQDMIQTAVGSSMRAGTGLALINDAIPQLAGMFKEDGGEPSLAFQQTMGRVAGDYLNTMSLMGPVTVMRDLYSLTDEELRIVGETGGEINSMDIALARAGRSLGPFRGVVGKEPLDDRFSLLRTERAKKVDPIRTMTTGLNISENANSVEKEANRLLIKPYELYRRFKFGPADVEIRREVSKRLEPLMSGYIQNDTYKKLGDKNKTLFFKKKAREIIKESSSEILEKLGITIEEFQKNNPTATDEDIKAKFGYNKDVIGQFKYETEVPGDVRAALEEDQGKPKEGQFQTYYLAGKAKMKQELAEGGLVRDQMRELSLDDKKVSVLNEGGFMDSAREFYEEEGIIPKQQVEEKDTSPSFEEILANGDPTEGMDAFQREVYEADNITPKRAKEILSVLPKFKNRVMSNADEKHAPQMYEAFDRYEKILKRTAMPRKGLMSSRK